MNLTPDYIIEIYYNNDRDIYSGESEYEANLFRSTGSGSYSDLIATGGGETLTDALWFLMRSAWEAKL